MATLARRDLFAHFFPAHSDRVEIFDGMDLKQLEQDLREVNEVFFGNNRGSIPSAAPIAFAMAAMAPTNDDVKAPTISRRAFIGGTVAAATVAIADNAFGQSVRPTSTVSDNFLRDYIIPARNKAKTSSKVQMIVPDIKAPRAIPRLGIKEGDHYEKYVWGLFMQNKLTKPDTRRADPALCNYMVTSFADEAEVSYGVNEPETTQVSKLRELIMRAGKLAEERADPDLTRYANAIARSEAGL
jgi:hypothetical protein